jgi:hypothetical protein
MRGWLIGGNLFLAGIFAALLVGLPLTDPSRKPSAAPLERGSMQALRKTDAPQTVGESPKEQTAEFARSLGIQTLLAMKAGARDPGSVRFRDVFTVNLGDDTERLILVCGQVTGKNGFGGYAGYVPFVASSERDIKVAGMAGFDGFYSDCIRGRPIVPINL